MVEVVEIQPVIFYLYLLQEMMQTKSGFISTTISVPLRTFVEIKISTWRLAYYYHFIM